MLNSKFFTVMNILVLLCVAAAIVLQCMELQEYGDIIEQLLGK